MEFESFQDGVLLYIGAEKGAAIPVDTVIAVIGKEGEDYKAALAGAGSTAEPVAVSKPEVKVESAKVETVGAPTIVATSSKEIPVPASSGNGRVVR